LVIQPASQIAHELTAPTVKPSLYLPTAQAEQVDPPATVCVSVSEPSSHIPQDVSVDVAEKYPTGHTVQMYKLLSVYFDAGQSMQSVAPGDNPAGAVASPVVMAGTSPAGQTRHFSTLEAWVNFPTGQIVQLVAPVRRCELVIQPASQIAHELTAPTVKSSLYLPTAQAEQVDPPATVCVLVSEPSSHIPQDVSVDVAEKYPTGHTVQVVDAVA
jgi:hypothetical protein